MIDLSTYRSKRRLIQALSTIFVVVLPLLNILRFDIPTLRFYFFTTALWIDEFYVVFLVSMLFLWIIVIFAMLYGRVWCGWMCPQTVFNEMYTWFRGLSRKWFRLPKNGGPLGRRIAADALLVAGAAAVSLFVAFNLVAYFVDPFRMAGELVSGTLGPVTSGVILSIAAVMFADIMMWREKFCTRACPYAMMQVVFTDRNTQVVRYQTERDAECIDCKACVRDCMMGIDIRTSPYQTECIHCGDCVDSCEAILGRLKTPLPTLISFAWGERQLARTAWYQKIGLIDPKRWIVVGITAMYALVIVAVINNRQPLSITASGDRSTLYYTMPDGTIQNRYAMRISNRGINDGLFAVTCSHQHAPGEHCGLALPENPVFLKSREVKDFQMSISTDGHDLHPGPNRLELQAVNTADPALKASTEIVFFMPEPTVSAAGTAHQGGL
jgi:cytochrome c oxidase accessory protein FixG